MAGVASRVERHVKRDEEEGRISAETYWLLTVVVVGAVVGSAAYKWIVLHWLWLWSVHPRGLAVGVAAIAALVLVAIRRDWLQNYQKNTFGFVVATAAATLLYTAIGDSLTAGISWSEGFVTFVPAAAKYASRPHEEALFLTSWQSNVLLAVTGVRGCGKSTLVSHSLANERGVLFVRPGPDESVEDAVKSALRAPSSIEMEHILVSAREAHQFWHPGDTTWLPTLVVEMDRHRTDEGGAIRLMKTACHDLRLCRGVIVLSTSEHVFHIPAQEDQRKPVIFIGDPEEEVAHEILDRRGLLLRGSRTVNGAYENETAAELRRTILSSMGTNPVVVLGAASAPDAHLYIKQYKTQVRMKLMGLVFGKHKGEPTSDDFARLFVALIDAYPSGVDVNTFYGINGDRIDPQALITVSIHSHVVVYNYPNATYHFHDVAFRDVAKEILIEGPTYKSWANMRLSNMIFSDRKVEEGEGEPSICRPDRQEPCWGHSFVLR